jgi:tetratricopeptide (TPR) repeat protein
MCIDLNTAWHLHQQRRCADAAQCYHTLLEHDPRNAPALHLFGILHHQNGYHARAVELIGRAIALRPDVAAYYANLAEVYRAQGQQEQSIACCWTALLLQPFYPEAANNLGLALHELGRHAEAVEQYCAALAMQPDYAVAQNNLGTALHALGQADEAMQAYRDAIGLDPNWARPRANLGQMLTERGEPAAALPYCQEAVRLDPNLPAAHNSLGNALRALQRWSEARDAYAAAVRLQPDLAVAHANLGLAIQSEGKLPEAVPHLRRAMELSLEDGDACSQVVNALALAEDWTTLISYAERRVQRQPNDADAHNDVGWIYQADGQLVAAERAYREALRLQPNHLAAWIHLGIWQEEQGLLAEAEASYRAAEVRHPRATAPLVRRALLLRGRLPEADRDRLRRALSAADLAAEQRLRLLFALAQVADGHGDFAEAAACLGPANALAGQQRRSEGICYAPEEHARFVDQLMTAFTPELFARLATAGDHTSQPIFVFGLPRSGTTLVEQVLASHSQVNGAGELPFLRRALEALPPVVAGTETPEARVQALDAATLLQLAGGYREAIRDLLAREDAAGQRADPQRVVDKMPDNYLYLGLIALLFPRATLIHVRRDLRDVAVSCWMNHFRSIAWADDAEHIARRSWEYQRLMAYWRRVLPLPIHEVRYEHLVDNFEAEAQQLVAVCGLDWEPACLQFHRTARPVRTASATQVRQPLYRRSVGRWQSYELHLAALFEKLPRE